MKIGDISQKCEAVSTNNYGSVTAERIRSVSDMAAGMSEFSSLPWDEQVEKLDLLALELRAAIADARSMYVPKMDAAVEVMVKMYVWASTAKKAPPEQVASVIPALLAANAKLAEVIPAI